MNIVSTALALDHLTAVDTTPSQLVALAAEVGYRAVCLFLEPMTVLPRLPQYQLIGDTPERRETRRRCSELGVRIDLAYPFTLAGRTDVNGFLPAIETAAWLDVHTLNVLLYDRDATRRFDNFARFCELAAEHGRQVAVEFYPTSQVRSLQDALELTARIARPGGVGVNVDLLHLVRSGGHLDQLRNAPSGSILYAQYCDGPADMALERREWEAGVQRLLPGEGTFNVREFAQVLPAGVRCSVEIPQEGEIIAGLTARERALRALQATQRVIN